ncbi:DMT family transporter [Psychromonas algicola]|uniref:DMT family transporter n=1 Tax=Psychromonas algicola TaxID=2555642 RepID=UPI00141A0285|nr:DMT family transporter [Psychromonas sp. RZ5]
MTGIIFIFFACLLWAADTLIRYPLLFGGSSAQQIVLFEHLILVTIIIGVFIVKRRRFNFMRRETLIPFIVIGVFGSALGTLAFTEAFYLSNPTVVILLQKLQPLVAVTLAYFLLKERISPRFFLWLGFALLGSLLLIWPDLQKLLISFKEGDVEANNVALWGYGLALFAVVSWGSATVFGKKLSSKGIDSVDLMAGRFSFGLLGMLPFVFMTPSLITTIEISILQKILILAVMSGLVGMYFYYQGLKRIPAHWATLAEMLFPVAAIFINWLFLNVEITQIQMIGAATLVVASTMVQFRLPVKTVLESS